MEKLSRMSPHSRVWFYGLEHPMSAAQEEALREMLDAFVADWKAHGADLAAAYALEEAQYLTIAVDESQQQATGCSIDKSVHLLQSFGASNGLDFFNRMLIHVRTPEGSKALTSAALKAAVAEGTVDAATPVRHALAATLGERGDGWIPLAQSWAAKYL